MAPTPTTRTIRQRLKAADAKDRADRRLAGKREKSEGSWRRPDSVFKGVFAAAITAAVLYSGYQIQRTQAEANRRTEILNAVVEFSANQKNLDVNIIMGMFNTLLGRFFERDSAAPVGKVMQEDLVLLRLIALNFQDVPINLKPLFEDFDRRLTKQNDEKGREDLRDTAQEVANRQAFRMTFNGGYDSGKITKVTGGTIEWEDFGIKLLVGETTAKDAEVTLVFEKEFGKEKRIGPFTVGYFDTPLVDNVKLPADMRFSVVLIKSDEKKATLRMVAFQSDLAADRFDVKEISRVLVNPPSSPGGFSDFFAFFSLD